MVETNIEAKPTTIHPALDFTSEHAYVGQIVRERRFQSLQIICDIRSILNFTDVNGEVSNVNLKCVNFKMEQRWSSEGIDGFLNGKEPIKPSQLFARLRKLFRGYIELSDERLYDFLTLWSIGTYFHWLFNAYPYVYVGGISGTGKTKLLTLCSLICFNSVSSGAISTASLFRLIQSTKCSVFLDESDALSNRFGAFEVRNLLLCGYKKGQRIYRAKRTDEGTFEAECFEVYSPKMLANIEGLEAVLSSRCIEIIMQRGSNRNITNREVIIDYPIWQQIRDTIYPFMMKNWKEVKRTYLDLQNDTVLQSRNWELWKPIMALAKFLGDVVLLEHIIDLAIEKAVESQLNTFELSELVLIETLLSIVDHDGFYKLKDIKCEMVKHLDDFEYLSFRHAGSLLRKLGFSKTKRIGSGYQYYLTVSKVTSLAQILVISEHSERSEHPGQQDTKTKQELVTEVVA